MCATDDLDELLENRSFWKAVRVFAWIVRFICNCKSSKAERTYGPLTTAETEARVQFWVKRATEAHSETEQFKEDKLKLNLQRNSDDLYECRGRIQGHLNYIYLPPNALITTKIIHNAHVQSLHGGVGSTTKQGSHKELLWLQEVPYFHISSPSCRTLTHRSNSRISAIRSPGHRLRWSYNL